MNADERKLVFKRFFEPESVAFVGASNTPGKWGFTILYHILQGEYKGRLHLVNPKGKDIFGMTVHKSIMDIDDTPDLAVLVVPEARLTDVMREVIDKGIKAAVVITSGFAEMGEEGRRKQDELVAMAREAGVRLVGPNSMGIFTGYPDRLASIMAAVIPEPGPVAVVSQSGNLGVSLMSRLLRRGVGISRAISVGNMADLNVADYLDLLADDDKTEIIAVYLEGTDKGRRLLESARNASRKKPVVLLKGATGKMGMAAAQSHTAALSGNYDTFRAAMKDAGVLLANTMDEAVNTIGALHSHPLPKGNRVGILTLGGGWGVLGTDACEKYGLDLPALPEKLIEELDKELPPFWSRANPIDTVASTNFMMIPRILAAMLRSERFDSVMYLGIGYLAYTGVNYRMHAERIRPELIAIGDQIIQGEKAMADMLLEHKKEITKPFLTVADLVVRDEPFEGNIVPYLEKNAFFVHNAPGQAAQALAAMLERKRFLDRVEGESMELPELPAPDPEKMENARKIVQAGLKREHRCLGEHESKQLLALLDIPFPEEREAATEDEAVEAAKAVGYPVVLKISNPKVLHKSESGGVVLNVRDEMALREAVLPILERGKVLVARMAEAAPVEVLVGLKSDPMFGPTLVFGKGGVETNVWNDAASLPAPVTPEQAGRMIDRTKVSKIVGEFRGRKALDRKALVDLMVKVSRLPEMVPEIAELDINPVFLYEEGVMAADAAIVLKKQV